ncbi:peptidoglycan-binding domain-containing protein [Agromyces badenianii]|uniref:peptidoglycan-binding domain-containing protein n=1 Tax=Agromyces badenianii TaxID=2080742 RepID=UPI000D59F83A|nr:hypothetical protein DCE94_05515 [Agromyces badenianii]
MPRPIPVSLGEAPVRQSVKVEPVLFSDTRTVNLQLETAAERTLSAPRAGVVTSIECAPGSAWASGAVPVTIDSVGIPAIHLAYPPWRDIDIGDEGPDVQALQDALSTLGFQVNADAEYDWSTAEAVQDFFRSRGVEHDQRSVSLSDYVWLPDSSMVPVSCPVAPGASVAPGSPIASLGEEVVGVLLVDRPRDLYEGPRTLTVGTAVVPLTDLSRVSEPGALATLAATPEAAAYRESGGKTEFTGRLELAEPRQLLSVPAGAVIGAGTDETCVIDDGRSVRVRVVASTLGSALLEPADPNSALPEHVDVARVGTSSTCS